MAAPMLVMAAGGTGGHMFPAQALSEAMLARGWRVRLMTDVRGARYTGGFSHAVGIVQVASGTTARGGLVARMTLPATIARGVASALWAFRQDRPAVVVGFGGYPTIPALAAATLMRLPRMIHEQNGVLGRVNTAFARRVDLVACGTWPTVVAEGARAEHTGNPVRSAIVERAGAPYIPPGDHPMQLLVMGGSQGARILSDVVPAAIAALPEEQRRHIRVAHQARDEDMMRVATAYAEAGIDADVQSFFLDIPRRLAEAQLVISRAGASSVADLCAIGRPAILVPYAAATGDHQTANARAMVEAGGAILIPEKLLDPAALSEHIAAILGQPKAAQRMAQGAQGLATLDATDRLAGLVMELAERGRGKT